MVACPEAAFLDRILCPRACFCVFVLRLSMIFYAPFPYVLFWYLLIINHVRPAN